MSVFVERVLQASQASHSLVCVGLDPEPERLPLADVLDFNRSVIDATAGLVAAYKPNLAFYEALGIPGFKALEGTIAHIRSAAPHAVIIGDAKRGDIGPSAQAYAKAMFRVWRFDAITANAWGGKDSLGPLLEDESRGVFVWCRGSNPGSANFQDLRVADAGGARPLYLEVALSCREWNANGNIGLVAGATVPARIKDIRDICPGMPLLVPGVGAQGGDLAAAVRASVDSNGRVGPDQFIPGHNLRLAERRLRPRRERCGSQAQGRNQRRFGAGRTGMVLGLKTGDVLRLKKRHPCGGWLWTVTRLGADIGMVCQECGRYVMMPRSQLARRVRTVVPPEDRGDGGVA